MPIRGLSTLQRLGLTYLASLLLTSLIAREIYQLWGYNLYTVALSLLLLGALGYTALRMEGLTARAVGATWANLPRALAVLALAYGLFLLVLWSLRTAGFIAGPLLRPPTAAGLIDNWLLTGGNEELLFRGYFLVVLARLLDRGAIPWRALLLSSLLFSLLHLPFALFAGEKGATLVLTLVLPFISALIVFGPVYLLSRNLWLAALVHGVTNYPIVSQIKDHPLLGLLFMGLVLLLGRFLLRSDLPLPVCPDTPGARKQAA